MLLTLLILTILLAIGVFFVVVLRFLNQKRRDDWFKNLNSTLLLVEIPRTNDKKELSAEQMFASLHGILRTKRDLKSHNEFQEHIGFEIVSIGKKIQFYVWVPTSLSAFVEGQIYAQYSDAQIKAIDPEQDYIHKIPDNYYSEVVEMGLTDDETLPIKTFPSFEVDPLAAITATLAKLETEDEVLGVQILARPIDDNWHKISGQKIASIKAGKSGFNPLSIAQVSNILWAPPDEKDTNKAVELSERERTRITSIEEKSRKLGYKVNLRLIYSCPPSMSSTARLKVQALVGAFKQFNTTNLNGFSIISKSNNLDIYKNRDFSRRSFILNIEELASLYHLPHSNVETPNIVWARSRTSEPPSNLPIYTSPEENNISLIGRTTFRGDNQMFGLTRGDRGRHVYIIGQTGVGKSALLELLLDADVKDNQGFAVIDPHGDLAVSTLTRIGPDRIKDVVYFNPADTDFPIGFNPLEFQNEAQKTMVASEIVGSLKKMFESWGPRLEYILRYTILSLLEYPDSTMLDITRLLTDSKFQKKVVAKVTDPVVKNFWEKEYASWNEKYRTEAVAPVLNKIGAFTANPIIRNIVGQPKGGFNVRQIMDEGKILVINLSRGLIGEDNAAILGSLLVTKIQLAAMSRADIADIADRRPFYLYVDEFQNFATDSFATILSEARKYGLNLTVANQYISQMTPGVRDAVFGNVGSIISFRVSPDDARSLTKYFEPQFEDKDIVQMHNRDFLANLTIYNEKTVPFSATTVDITYPTENHIAEIVDLNRHKFAKPRAEVEEAIYLTDSGQFKAQLEQKAPKPKPPTEPEFNPEILKSPEIKKDPPSDNLVKNIFKALSFDTDDSEQSDPEPDKTPRKRRRKRGKRNKSSDSDVKQEVTSSENQKPDIKTSDDKSNPKPEQKPARKDDETTIYLR